MKTILNKILLPIQILLFLVVAFVVTYLILSGLTHSKIECKDKKAKYLKGIDVSHYQGEVNWSDVKKDSIAFVYLKATEGDQYIDPILKKNVNALKTHEIPFGFYHFFEPSKDAETQAKHFYNETKQFKANLPPVLDIEISQGIETTEIHEKIGKWLNDVHEKYGNKPIIYTSKDFKKNVLKEKFDDYEFWIAEYNTNSLSENWMIWQYSQKGKICGINGYVDLNYLHGEKVKILLK